jgi:2-methylcitrate dehydratase PrpD
VSDARYADALLDWLACASAGRAEPAARAAAATLGGDGGPEGRTAAAGAAGHVLDFDDTYLPGIAHLSAPVAPAALTLGAEREATVADVLAAYVAGFEAMGSLARAGHPALYDGGWHPTAVCGSAGAAVAASRLLGHDPEREEAAVALALLRAGGLRSGFGNFGKSLGVGMAAAAGVAAARLAAAGTGAGLPQVAHGAAAYEEAFGARFELDDGVAAIEQNWIKAYPCCLQTHGAIECALALGEDPGGPLEVVVHPLSLQAAAIESPADRLEAKFSIPYLTAFALLRGAPQASDFGAVDEEAARLAAERISVRTDPALLESEAVLLAAGEEVARVKAARGSPERPLGAEGLAAKRRALGVESLEGILDDGSRPARELLEAAGL